MQDITQSAGCSTHCWLLQLSNWRLYSQKKLCLQWPFFWTNNFTCFYQSFMNWPLVNGRDDFAIMLLLTKFTFTKSLLDLSLFVNKLRCCAKDDFSCSSFFLHGLCQRVCHTVHCAACDNVSAHCTLCKQQYAGNR